MNNMVCKVHNEPALYCEQDNQQIFCVQQRCKIQNIDDAENEEKQALKQLEIKFEQSINQLKNLAQVLEQFTLQIQQKLQNLKQQVEHHISYLIDKKNLVKNISDDFTNLQLNKINEQKNIMNNQLTQVIFQLNKQIKEVKFNTKLEQIYQLLKNQQIEENCNLKQMDDSKKITVMDKKFDYQLMLQSFYKQKEYCYAIAFNKDATIMIAGCNNMIKVFEFQNQKLRELQKLSGHSNNVCCLKFMKKSNQFISGSQDKTMIIWNLNQNKQWQGIQVMKEHTNYIFCIIINQNEDLLISGSIDNTIKFWSIQDNTWRCNQSIDCQSYVYCISLNDSEDQLIACVYNNQILVIQLQAKEWMIQQKISVEQFGQRLCYTSLNQFVFQPYNSQYLQIFDQDAQNSVYKKGQELQYQNQEIHDNYLFPIQYISKLGLIIVKNCKHVHLIKRNQNGTFIVEQSINFNTHNIFGCITDDGSYIATWDEKSNQIQLWQFKF